MIPLQDRLLAAHNRDDRGALVGLYTEAAQHAGDIDAKCFFLTHAYIFALEACDPAADTLYQQLNAHGRV